MQRTTEKQKTQLERNKEIKTQAIKERQTQKTEKTKKTEPKKQRTQK